MQCFMCMGPGRVGEGGRERERVRQRESEREERERESETEPEIAVDDPSAVHGTVVLA